MSKEEIWRITTFYFCSFVFFTCFLWIWLVILIQYIKIKKFKIPENATYTRKQIKEIRKDKDKKYIPILYENKSSKNTWMIFLIVVLPFLAISVLIYGIIGLTPLNEPPWYWPY